MTLSEIHVVMTGGYATIAGSLLGAYISFGVRTAPFGLLKTKNLKPTFVGAPHSSFCAATELVGPEHCPVMMALLGKPWGSPSVTPTD